MCEAQTEGQAVPAFVLDTNRRDWILQNHTGPFSQPIKLENAQMYHNVCARNNRNLNIFVESKVNTIVLENCSDVTLVLHHVIANLELISSNRCKVQVLGKISSVTIDKCADIEIYFSYESRDVQLTTCHVNGITVYYQKFQNSPDDWIELPVPAQYLHYLSPGSNSLITKASTLFG